MVISNVNADAWRGVCVCVWLIDGASGRRHGTVPRVLGGADDCVFVVGPAYEVDPVLLAQHGPCRSGTSCEQADKRKEGRVPQVTYLPETAL